MAKVLIVAEHLGGKLNASTAKVVSAAKALNPESIDVVVLAADPSAVAAEAAKLQGVSRVLAVGVKAPRTASKRAVPLRRSISPRSSSDKYSR